MNRQRRIDRDVAGPAPSIISQPADYLGNPLLGRTGVTINNLLRFVVDVVDRICHDRISAVRFAPETRLVTRRHNERRRRQPVTRYAFTRGYTGPPTRNESAVYGPNSVLRLTTDFRTGYSRTIARPPFVRMLVVFRQCPTQTVPRKTRPLSTRKYLQMGQG